MNICKKSDKNFLKYKIIDYNNKHILNKIIISELTKIFKNSSYNL